MTEAKEDFTLVTEALTTFTNLMIGSEEGFVHAYYVWSERKRLSTLVSTNLTRNKRFEDGGSQDIIGDPMMKILT